MFDGWYLGSAKVDSINWADIAYSAPAEGTGAEVDGKWVITKTKSATLTGTFTQIQHTYIYELTFKGPAGATLPTPNPKVNTGSAPAIAGETASLANHYFKGWGAISAYAENTTRLDKSDPLHWKHYLEANVEAQFLEIEYKYAFDATYMVDGTQVDAADTKTSAIENDGPTIRGQQTKDDYVFDGWYLGSAKVDAINWADIAYNAPAEGTGAEVDGKWVITKTKSATLTGTFTQIQHADAERYILYLSVSGATTDSGKQSSAPGFPADAAAPGGYVFDGWYQNGTKVSAIDWGTKAADGEPVSNEDGTLITQYYLYSATLEARFIQTGKEHAYTLSYHITSTFAGQPGDPADEGPSTSPMTPDDGNVPGQIEVNGEFYYFSGWSDPTRTEEQDGTYLNNEGILITRYKHTATVEGFYTNITDVREETRYSLYYEGAVAGVLYWPLDEIGVETPPTLAGKPYLNGYIFTGWTPSTLNWENAEAKITRRVVMPSGGEEGQEAAPYVLVTTTYELRVRAGFTLGGGGDGPLLGDDPEIPLGIPHTGGMGLAGAAAILMLSGLAITTGTLVQRRKENEEDE